MYWYINRPIFHPSSSLYRVRVSCSLYPACSDFIKHRLFAVWIILGQAVCRTAAPVFTSGSVSNMNNTLKTAIHTQKLSFFYVCFYPYCQIQSQHWTGTVSVLQTVWMFKEVLFFWKPAARHRLKAYIKRISGSPEKLYSRRRWNVIDRTEIKSRSWAKSTARLKPSLTIGHFSPRQTCYGLSPTSSCFIFKPDIRELVGVFWTPYT